MEHDLVVDSVRIPPLKVDNQSNVPAAAKKISRAQYIDFNSSNSSNASLNQFQTSTSTSLFTSMFYKPCYGGRSHEACEKSMFKTSFFFYLVDFTTRRKSRRYGGRSHNAL